MALDETSRWTAGTRRRDVVSRSGFAWGAVWLLAPLCGCGGTSGTSDADDDGMGADAAADIHDAAISDTHGELDPGPDGPCVPRCDESSEGGSKGAPCGGDGCGGYCAPCAMTIAGAQWEQRWSLCDEGSRECVEL